MSDIYPFSHIDFTQDPELVLRVPVPAPSNNFSIRAELHPHLKVIRTFDCGWIHIDSLNNAVISYLSSIYNSPTQFTN